MATTEASNKPVVGRPVGVIISNNAPDPTAKVLADLKMDVATRFSVSPSAVMLFDTDSMPLSKGDEMTPLQDAPERFLVLIKQSNGATTQYLTVIEKAA